MFESKGQSLKYLVWVVGSIFIGVVSSQITSWFEPSPPRPDLEAQITTHDQTMPPLLLDKLHSLEAVLKEGPLYVDEQFEEQVLINRLTVNNDLDEISGRRPATQKASESLVRFDYHDYFGYSENVLDPETWPNGYARVVIKNSGSKATQSIEVAADTATHYVVQGLQGELKESGRYTGTFDLEPIRPGTSRVVTLWGRYDALGPDAITLTVSEGTIDKVEQVTVRETEIEDLEWFRSVYQFLIFMGLMAIWAIVVVGFVAFIGYLSESSKKSSGEADSK
jgi:hypothetical protein